MRNRVLIHLYVSEGHDRANPPLHYDFDERIDRAIQKSIKATLRMFRERRLQARGANEPQAPPSREEFNHVLEGFMMTNRAVDLKKLRIPSLQTLFERAWAQNLRSYATQQLLHDSYNALTRRY